MCATSIPSLALTAMHRRFDGPEALARQTPADWQRRKSAWNAKAFKAFGLAPDRLRIGACAAAVQVETRRVLQSLRAHWNAQERAIGDTSDSQQTSSWPANSLRGRPMCCQHAAAPWDARKPGKEAKDRSAGVRHRAGHRAPGFPAGHRHFSRSRSSRTERTPETGAGQSGCSQGRCTRSPALCTGQSPARLPP